MVKGDSPVASQTVFLKIFESAEKKKGSRCSGVIIAPKLILTAGHCLKYRGLIIDVHFGLGGSNGFKEVIQSKTYVSSKIAAGEANNSETAVDPFTDGFLAYNEAAYAAFVASAEARTKLENLSGEAFASEDEFRDLAVIKIDHLPKGYRPVRFFYPRDLKFGQPLISAGFGLSSRTQSKITIELKSIPQKLIGHATDSGNTTHALQIFSKDGGICMGDSGGPTFIEDNGELKLVGINDSVFNNCANSKWISLPLHYGEFLLKAIFELGGSFSI
jgi:hypothetical protein